MNPAPIAIAADLTGADPELDRRVHEARLMLVFSRALLPLFVGIPFACLLVWLVWGEIADSLLLTWLGAKVVIALVRIAQTAVYRRSQDDLSASRRVIPFVLMIVLDGAVWGSLLILFTSPDRIASSAVLYASMIGVSAIGSVSLSAYFNANAGFTIALLLPAALYTLSEGRDFELFTGVAVLLFLGLSLLDGRRAARAVDELLRMRFQFDSLAAERAEALQLAEHHSAVKSQFLATMSHEMRTPLHGMLGTLQLLRGRLPGAEERDQLALVERSGEHLLAIINDVLDFSKIEAGKMQFDEQPLALDKLLSDVIELCAPAAERKALVLRLQSSLPTPAWILGDVARIRQVVLNLVGNALKFTEAGGVTVVARVDDGTLHIAVRDTGIGIPAAELAGIFDAFRQVDGSFARRFSGTGLGLTISRQLARAMGGDLSCDSAVGAGSTFHFSLPWRTTAPAQVAVPPTDADRPLLLNGHVLLVDDNAVNLMVAESMLEKFGLRTVVATNGEEAVAAYAEDRPAIVLMDCHMPVLDGFAATRRIRELETAGGAQRIPVIAVTANAFDDERERCLACGMDDHLAKPFREEDLRAMVQRHLPEVHTAA